MRSGTITEKSLFAEPKDICSLFARPKLKIRRLHMGKIYKSSVLIVLASLLSLGIGAGATYGASKFPEKPITLVVGTAPGAGADILARLIAATNDKYKFLSQAIVVENKPGGSHAIAMAYVSGKKKDPHFLLNVSGSFITSPLTGLSPLSLKDFTPICNLSFDEHVAIVNFNSKFKFIKDVVDYAKVNPETVTIGGAQLGAAESINHYNIEKAAGIKLKFVSFGGGGDALVALLGGHIDMVFVNPCEALDLLKANKVRALGVLTEKRLAGAPDIPTIKEQGLNVVGAGMNRGLAAPGGIPEDARKLLEEALLKFSQTDEYKKFHKDNMITEGWMDSFTFANWLDGQNNLKRAVLMEMGLIKK
jgi:putative tricarboxylic transport membrane protein